MTGQASHGRTRERAIVLAVVAVLLASISAATFNVAPVKAAAAETETSLVASPQPSAMLRPVTLTARVFPNPGAGTVQFIVDGNAVGDATVDATGIAEADWVPGEPGGHALKAAFQGTDEFQASTSPVQNHVVEKPALAVPWFDVTAPNVFVGDYARITGGVEPIGSNGNLEVGGNVWALNPATGLIPSDAVVQFSFLHQIPEEVVIAPSHDHSTNFGWSVGCPQTLSISMRPGSPVLSAEQPTVRIGEAIRLTLTAYDETLDPAPDSWSADVFGDQGAGDVKIRQLSGIQTPAKTFVISPTALGHYRLYAELTGDFWWSTPRSNTIDVNVVSASDAPAPALPAAAPGAVATTITLSAATNPSVKGTKITYSATVTPAPGAARVRVFDGSEEVIAIDLDAATGAGTSPLYALRSGDHTLRAEFTGNDSFAPSISEALNTTVNADPMTITITGPSSVQAGEPATYTATFSDIPPQGSRFTWFGGLSEFPTTLNGNTDHVTKTISEVGASDGVFRTEASLIFDSPFDDALSNVFETQVIVPSVSVTLDTPPQPINPTVHTNVVAHLTPALTGSDAIVHISIDGSMWQVANLVNGTATASVSLSPGHHTLRASVFGLGVWGDAVSAPASVNVSDFASRADIHGTVIINGDTGFANTTTVQVLATLDSDSVSAKNFQLSNDGHTWATFQYNRTGDNDVDWSLTDARCGGTPGDGTHTLYYRFSNGSEAASPVESVTVTVTHPVGEGIVLDRVDPTATAPTGTPQTGPDAQPAIKVVWSASDDRSGIGAMQLDVSKDGGAWTALPAVAGSAGTAAASGVGARSVKPATTQAASVVVTGLHAGSTYTFRIRPNDRAGNTGPWLTSDPVVAQPAHDTTAPVVGVPTELYRLNQAVSAAGALPIAISWTGSDNSGTAPRFDLQGQTDAGAWTAITLTSPTTKQATRTVTSGHSYRYQVRGKDVSANTSAWRIGPTFKASVLQETSTAIIYSTGWTTSRVTSAFGGSTRTTTKVGATATLTRSMRDFAWVATIAAGRGSVDVYVDGVKVKRVSLAGSATKPRTLVYVQHWGAAASHTIKLKVVTGKVDLDALLLAQ